MYLIPSSMVRPMVCLPESRQGSGKEGSRLHDRLLPGDAKLFDRSKFNQ